MIADRPVWRDATRKQENDDRIVWCDAMRKRMPITPCGVMQLQDVNLEIQVQMKSESIGTRFGFKIPTRMLVEAHLECSALGKDTDQTGRAYLP